jgi:hypothetical protein
MMGFITLMYFDSFLKMFVNMGPGIALMSYEVMAYCLIAQP